VSVERDVVVRAGERQGTGYLLAARLVLTSGHLVAMGGRTTVQLQHGPARVAARAVWWVFEDGETGVQDAALLELEEDATSTFVPPVRWGRLVTEQRCPGRVTAYPAAGRTPGEELSTVRLHGDVDPVSGRERDRYVLTVPGGARERAHRSPWKGASGAALLCGSAPDAPPLVTGVVTGSPAGWSSTRLDAVPAYVLAHDPSFRALVRAHTGRDVRLLPADLDHLAENAVPRAPRSPADLLRPEHAVVAFREREELHSLTEWCLPEAVGTASPVHGPDVQVRLLTGPGGSGKTRLANELSARLEQHGWTTLRLSADTSAPLGCLAGVRRPLLVVLDYAETRVGQLKELLKAVDREDLSNPVRILALARRKGDWWDRPAAELHGHLLSVAHVVHVPPLHGTTVDRSDALQEALDSFVAPLGRLAGTYAGVDWEECREKLRNPGVNTGDGSFPGTPLSVQMSALLALLDTAGLPSTPETATSPEERLLGHEQRYWDGAIRDRELSPGLVTGANRSLAVALACLVHPESKEEARTLLARLPGMAGESAAATRGELANWLHDLYPATGGAYWGSLQPDRLAERHVGAQVRAEPGVFAVLLAELGAAPARRALTLLSRAAEYQPHEQEITRVLCAALEAVPVVLGTAAVETATQVVGEKAAPEPLRTALARWTDGSTDVGQMRALLEKVPQRTDVLAEWAAHLAGRISAHTEPAVSATALRAVIEKAGALLDHAKRLAAVDDRARALDLAGQAVRLLEEPGDPWADEGRAALALALTQLASHLTQDSDWPGALAAAERAVALHERLVATHPADHLPAMAEILQSQAIALAHLDRRHDALHAFTRAVDTCRILADRDAAQYLDLLAVAQYNRAKCLGDLHRFEDALTAASEAVTIRQGLAARHPDAYRPALANALENCSVWLDRLEKPEEALRRIDTAAQIRRRLATAYPERYTADLARSLTLKSNCLALLGRRLEALVTIDEAVQLHESLGTGQCEGQEEAIVDTLTRRSDRLAELDRRADALEAVNTAVARCRLLPRDDPAAACRLARVLTRRSDRLAELGRGTEALEVLDEAVSVLEREGATVSAEGRALLDETLQWRDERRRESVHRW
jgi:tetratricopeptide (TPR) repeat protein